MLGDPIVLGWLVILFGASALYARFLARPHVRERYDPDWTWATVVGGNTLIGGALLGMEWMGVPLTFWLVVASNVAAGIPIIIWQLVQYFTRHARNGH